MTLIKMLLWFQSVFLPQGYPESVSEDYLIYQIYDTIQVSCQAVIVEELPQIVFCNNSITLFQLVALLEVKIIIVLIKVLKIFWQMFFFMYSSYIEHITHLSLDVKAEILTEESQ